MYCGERGMIDGLAASEMEAADEFWGHPAHAGAGAYPDGTYPETD